MKLAHFFHALALAASLPIITTHITASDTSMPTEASQNQQKQEKITGRQLEHAMFEKDIKQLTAWLENGSVDLNDPMVQPYDSTLLMNAISYNNPAMVELFLQHNAHISPLNGLGNNALHEALRFAYHSKDFTIVNMIIDAAEKDTITKNDPAFDRQLFFNDHSYPLLKIAAGDVFMPNVASSAEEIAVIQRLINAGANINSTGKKEGGWTALMVAANSSNVPLVTFLLNQKGINTSIRSREVDEPGWKQPSQSVYDLAADKPEIQSLLHAFAKKHLNDQSFVASGPSDIIADYLHGTPETPKTAQQATNDPYAFIKDNDLEGLAEWIHQEKKRNPRFDINAARFDLNTDDLDGDKKYPLLALAAKENKPEIIQFLLNIMGADLKARGSDNETALHIAALFGRSESTAVLIGADPSRATIDAEAAYLQTPLMYVARSPMTDEHLNVAKLLIEANANVNAKDWESFTPLMDAASQGNYPLVELLLAHGARASDTRLTPEGHHEAAIDHIADDAPNNAELRALLEKHMATEAAQKATHTHAEEKTDQAEKEGKSTDAE